MEGLDNKASMRITDRFAACQVVVSVAVELSKHLESGDLQSEQYVSVMETLLYSWGRCAKSLQPKLLPIPVVEPEEDEDNPFG